MGCVSGGCKEPVVHAVYLGSDWPDGRRRYTQTCQGHLRKVLDYQASIGSAAWVFAIDQVELVLCCSAAWRSHACGRPEDHEGIHVCDPGVCGDEPRDDDDVFELSTFNPCQRIGGVSRADEDR